MSSRLLTKLVEEVACNLKESLVLLLKDLLSLVGQRVGQDAGTEPEDVHHVVLIPGIKPVHSDPMEQIAVTVLVSGKASLHSLSLLVVGDSNSDGLISLTFHLPGHADRHG